MITAILILAGAIVILSAVLIIGIVVIASNYQFNKDKFNDEGKL